MAAFSDAVYKRRVQPDAVPLGRKYVLQISAKPMKEKTTKHCNCNASFVFDG